MHDSVIILLPLHSRFREPLELNHQETRRCERPYQFISDLVVDFPWLPLPIPQSKI